MDIIIGRDTKDSRLLLTADGKDVVYGQPDSVPQSVAPKHCLLSFTSDAIRLKNLDINNYTYVNGQSIESKNIIKGDRIELGGDQYLLDWKPVLSLMPADIRPLKTVWDDFENISINLQIKERRFNTLRSATGLITMVAIAMGVIMGGKNHWYLALYALAILTSIVFFIKAYLDSARMPKIRQELNRKFQQDYVCPHCGHFLGNQSYDILTQNDCCPFCKAKFIH